MLFCVFGYAQDKEKTQPNHSFVTKKFGILVNGEIFVTEFIGVKSVKFKLFDLKMWM